MKQNKSRSRRKSCMVNLASQHQQVAKAKELEEDFLTKIRKKIIIKEGSFSEVFAKGGWGGGSQYLDEKKLFVGSPLTVHQVVMSLHKKYSSRPSTNCSLIDVLSNTIKSRMPDPSISSATSYNIDRPEHIGCTISWRTNLFSGNPYSGTLYFSWILLVDVCKAIRCDHKCEGIWKWGQPGFPSSQLAQLWQKSFDHEMPEERAGTRGLENIFTFKFCSWQFLWWIIVGNYQIPIANHIYEDQ